MRDFSNWYWELGINRVGEHRIGPGDWLYPVMDIEKRFDTACVALQSRPTIAVWGPSQVGKSILLSRYLDGDNPDGSDSALSWDGGAIFRFAHSQDTPDATLCLNPVVGGGTDATAVVTRYVGRDTIPDVHFPVELKLLGSFQWIYAFAIGYLNLCEHPAKAVGEIEFRTAIDALGPATEGQPNSGACEALFTLAEILDAFIESREASFSNLGIEDKWKKSLRPMMFNTPQLNQNRQNVEGFMAKLLWDDNPAINNVVSEIRNFKSTVMGSWEGKPIFCSMEAAQLIMDFQTLDKCRPDANQNDAARVRELVSQLSWQEVGAQIKIGFNFPNLFGEAGFACLQTLTAELQVPVRLDRIRHQAFRDVINRFDLLDFPGVTNMAAGANQAQPYQLERMSQDVARHKLFTMISKYGKTLSLVFSSAKTLSIDTFLLLLKTAVNQLARNPACIQSSLKEWAAQLGFDRLEKAPLCLDISFFSDAIVSVAGMGIGFDEIIQYTCNQLPCTANPGRVSTFVTNYPWLAGNLRMEGVNQENILQQADNSPRLKQFMPDCRENLTKLFEDGAVDYMLQKISGTLDVEHRRCLVRRLVGKDERKMRDLVESRLPTEQQHEIEEKRAAVEGVIHQLNQCSRPSDKLQETCMFIKKLMKVDADILEPLPTHVANGNIRIFSEYVSRQLSRWCENKLVQFDSTDKTQCFIFDGENGSEKFRLFLRTLIEGCNRASLVEWTSDSFRHFENAREAGRARTLVALGISNALWTGKCIRPARVRSATPTLELFTQHEYDQDDPAYSVLNLQILQPFMNRCIQLRDGDIRNTARGVQPGDPELQKLMDNLAQLFTIRSDF